MSGQGALANILPIALMLAAVWFLLIRPQQQRQKKQAEMISKLEAGAEIVTIGGIYGTIVEVGEDRLLVEVADGSRMEISRRAVGSVVPEREEDRELSDDDEGDGAPVGELAPADTGDDESGA